MDHSTLASRMKAATWIAQERMEYSDHKYADGSENREHAILDMRDHGIGEDSEWWVFITNYLKRAQLLGVDTLAGRQAFGKAIVTMMQAFETSILVYGNPPLPGYTTGEIVSEAKVTVDDKQDEDE